MYACVCVYTYIYVCVCVCTGICHQCPVSFEASQMCRLIDISPTFAAGWRACGVFCNAAEMVCPWFCRTGFYSWFLIHDWFFFPSPGFDVLKGTGLF